MVVALQIAIASLIFLLVFVAIFIMGATFGYIAASNQINDPKNVKARLERELGVE